VLHILDMRLSTRQGFSDFLGAEMLESLSSCVGGVEDGSQLPSNALIERRGAGVAFLAASCKRLVSQRPLRRAETIAEPARSGRNLMACFSWLQRRIHANVRA